MFPDGIPDNKPPKSCVKSTKENIASIIGQGTVEALDSESKFRLWSQIIAAYTSCFLTFSTDKLPALSGLAKVMQPLLGDRYLAGLWWDEVNIHKYLAWACKVKYEELLPRPEGYHAPTWSWASTSNAVSFASVYPRDSPNLRILSATTTPLSDPTSRVTGGYLHVEGPVNEVIIVRDESDKIEMVFQGKKEYYEIYLDAPAELPLTCYTLPLRTENRNLKDANSRHTGDWRHFLLLRQSVGFPGCYERCGIGRFGSSNLWPDGTFFHLSHNNDIPCEEYISPEKGHRIRIV